MGIENPDEHLLVLLLTLNCGKQDTANLSRTQIKEFLVHFEQGKNYVTTVMNETFGFNPTLISNFRVIDLYQKEFKVVHKEEKELPEKEKEITIETITEEISEKETELAKAYETEMRFFKIDCVCGATYVVEISSKTTRGSCNKCKERLYVDRSKQKVETYKGKAWITTNRYHVTSEMMNAPEQENPKLY